MTKYLGFFVTTLLLLISTYTEATATGLISCDGCSAYQSKKAAESVYRESTIVVTDAINGNVRVYDVYKKIVDDNIWEFRATLKTTDIEVENKFRAFFLKSQEFKNALVSAKGDDDTIKYYNLPGARDGTDAVDFLDDSEYEKHFYDIMESQFPQILEGSFANKITIEFYDGSKIEVTLDYDRGRIVIESAVDGGGRDLPLRDDASPAGIYTVTDQASYDELAEYLNRYWSTSFGAYTAPGQSCTMDCKVLSTERYECTYKCK
jgi:hypothetical protein